MFLTALVEGIAIQTNWSEALKVIVTVPVEAAKTLVEVPAAIAAATSAADKLLPETPQK